MNDRNLKSKQRGIFSIEFAIVGICFSLLLAFSGDVIIKLSIKGKLDRLSYSLVNVLKERTQLYGMDYQLTSEEVDSLNKIAKNSLSRTFGNFDVNKYGMLVEELSFSEVDVPNPVISEHRGAETCHVNKSIGQLKELTVLSVRGRTMPLYRVALCYESDNWFGDLVDKSYTTVMSDSIVIGR
ncbi:tight adherence pilus pseudopilin TadF [Aliivibrio fischeri]